MASSPSEDGKIAMKFPRNIVIKQRRKSGPRQYPTYSWPAAFIADLKSEQTFGLPLQLVAEYQAAKTKQEMTLFNLRATLFFGLSICKKMRANKDALATKRRDLRKRADQIENSKDVSAARKLRNLAAQQHLPDLSRIQSILLYGYMKRAGANGFSRSDWRPLLSWLAPLLGIGVADPREKGLQKDYDVMALQKIQAKVVRFRDREGSRKANRVSNEYFASVRMAKSVRLTLKLLTQLSPL